MPTYILVNLSSWFKKSFMKNSILIFIFLVLAIKSFAQSAVPNNIRATNTLDRLFDQNGLSNSEMLYGIPMPPGKVIGDTYLETHWQNSTILLYEKDKLIEGYPVRYDIQTDELEIKAKNGIKVLSGNKVKSFVWLDSLTKKPTYFVNAKEYANENNIRLVGFFQVIADGSLPLFKRSFIEVKKADYNVQFNVGSRDDKILKKQELYYVRGNQVVEVPSSKKKLLPVFGDKSAAVEKYAKDNALTYTKEEHLKLMFEHYNSLFNN